MGLAGVNFLSVCPHKMSKPKSKEGVQKVLKRMNDAQKSTKNEPVNPNPTLENISDPSGVLLPCICVTLIEIWKEKVWMVPPSWPHSSYWQTANTKAFGVRYVSIRRSWQNQQNQSGYEQTRPGKRETKPSECFEAFKLHKYSGSVSTVYLLSSIRDNHRSSARLNLVILGKWEENEADGVWYIRLQTTGQFRPIQSISVTTSGTKQACSHAALAADVV